MDIFQVTLMLAVMFNFFKENTELKVLLEDENHENKFLNLLFQYTFTCMSNSAALDVVERGVHGEIMPAKYGSGIFSLSSLINHSCLSNVIKTFYQSTHAALRVSLPIKKGSQLFDNYGPSHMLTPKKERQQQLKMIYHFLCDCVACTNDYPMEYMMPKRTPISNIITPFDDDRYELLDSKTAVNNLKKYQLYVEKNYHYYPCQRLFAIQNLLERSFKKCFGNVSLNTKSVP